MEENRETSPDSNHFKPVGGGIACCWRISLQCKVIDILTKKDVFYEN